MSRFQNIYHSILKENMMAVDILGSNSDKPYDTSDVRTPKIFGTLTRKGKLKKKKAK
jgi:hypothetical protein